MQRIIRQAMGLGDIVERITKATRIKWIVERIWGDDCGCDERKDQLNDIELPKMIKRKQK